MQPTIDPFDVKILNLVQRNNRLSAREIGSIVGLSTAACQRRLDRLRREKVILSDVSIVDPTAVGRRLQMLVMVTLERERADIIDRFKRAIAKTPEVMLGYYVTGDVDFVLVMSAHDMEDYEAFTRRFLYENPDIKSIKTLVVLDRLKTGFAITIDAASAGPATGRRRATNR